MPEAGRRDGVGHHVEGQRVARLTRQVLGPPRPATDRTAPATRAARRHDRPAPPRRPAWRGPRECASRCRSGGHASPLRPSVKRLARPHDGCDGQRAVRDRQTEAHGPAACLPARSRPAAAAARARRRHAAATVRRRPGRRSRRHPRVPARAVQPGFLDPRPTPPAGQAFSAARREGCLAMLLEQPRRGLAQQVAGVVHPRWAFMFAGRSCEASSLTRQGKAGAGMDGIARAVGGAAGRRPNTCFDARCASTGVDEPRRQPRSLRRGASSGRTRRCAAPARALGLEIGTDAAANLYMDLAGCRPCGAGGGDRLASGQRAAWRQFRRCGRRRRRTGSAGRGAAATRRAPVPAMSWSWLSAPEESIWFEVSYIGSRAALGTPAGWGTGGAAHRHRAARWAEHMRDCGADSGCAGRVVPGTSNRARLRAYVELHIEQAPEPRSKPACRSASAPASPGTFRHPYVTIEGETAHVGLPRRFRHDAAMAGADFAMAMDRVWQEHEARGVPMCFTIGRFHTDPAQHGLTIVPRHLPVQPGCSVPTIRRCWRRWSSGSM